MKLRSRTGPVGPAAAVSLLPWVVVLALVPMMSCSLFETRDPEQPAVLRSTYDPPVEPLTVLTNMTAAFRELNEVNYLRCLSDSLTGGTLDYQPTPEAASRYGVFASWSNAEEREYFLNIRSRLPSGASLGLSFDVPTLQSRTSDSAQVEVTYDLIAPHGQQSVPDRGRGRAQFVLVLDRSTGFWAIRRWADFAIDATTASWSDIKGAFSQ